MVATAPTHRGRPAASSSSSPATAVLVAHNAPFDVGFLKAAAVQCQRPWPTPRGARHRPPRPPGADPRRGPRLQAEPPSLGTSGPRPRPTTGRSPTHAPRSTCSTGSSSGSAPRGSSPSRSCVTYSSRVVHRRSAASATSPRACPRRRASTSSRTPPGDVLYVGKSGDLRAARAHLLHRQRDPQPDGRDGRAGRVGSTTCRAPTALEAEVRELRLIAEHKPRYNRRSRFPERAVWVKLTVEAFPRLSVVREVRADGATYLGPFGRRRSRRAGGGRRPRGLPDPAVHGPAVPRRPRPARACWPSWAGAGRRAHGHEDVDDYSVHVDAVRRALVDDPTRPHRAPSSDASPGCPTRSATRRPPPTATGSPRSSGPPPAPSGSPRWPACHELVAARPGADEGWEIAAHPPRPAGRHLPGSRRGTDPWPIVDALHRHRPRSCRSAAAAGSKRRGVRVPAALARRHRHPPGAPRRHVGVPRARRRRLDRPVHARRRFPPPVGDGDGRALARPFGRRGVTVAP